MIKKNDILIKRAHIFNKLEDPPRFVAIQDEAYDPKAAQNLVLIADLNGANQRKTSPAAYEVIEPELTDPEDLRPGDEVLTPDGDMLARSAPFYDPNLDQHMVLAYPKGGKPEQNKRYALSEVKPKHGRNKIKAGYFSEYQKKSRATAFYPAGLAYPALGLCGEAGEVAEKVKKIIRDSRGVVTPEAKLKLGKELGDVLWYLAQLCTELGLDLQNVAAQNLEKLAARSQAGTLQGSGDDR